MTTRYTDSVEFEGTTTFTGTVRMPTGSLTNASFSSSSSDRLTAAKVVHRVDLTYSQANGSNVASETKVLRICRGIGTVKAVKVRPTTAPTGGDKAYTVDVLKAGDASGSWTSLLSSVVTVNSSSADNTLQSGTLIGSPTTAADDSIRIVVTASGSTGSQGQGVCVTIFYEENPE